MYNLNEYDREKQEALALWADTLTALVTAARIAARALSEDQMQAGGYRLRASVPR
jgi:hypothetical protein